MDNNRNNGRVKVKYAMLGGAIGGLISSLVSSPQSQFYWWKEAPGNRWNIALWDTVAISLTSFILGKFTRRNSLKWLSAGTAAIGGLLTYKLKKNPDFLKEL